MKLLIYQHGVVLIHFSLMSSKKVYDFLQSMSNMCVRLFPLNIFKVIVIIKINM